MYPPYIEVALIYHEDIAGKIYFLRKINELQKTTEVTLLFYPDILLVFK